MSNVQFEFYETRDIMITSKPQFVNMDHFLLSSNFCIQLSSTIFIIDVKYTAWPKNTPQNGAQSNI